MHQAYLRLARHASDPALAAAAASADRDALVNDATSSSTDADVSDCGSDDDGAGGAADDDEGPITPASAEVDPEPTLFNGDELARRFERSLAFAGVRRSDEAEADEADDDAKGVPRSLRRLSWVVDGADERADTLETVLRIVEA